MARWRLRNPHYLNVPGTEWEYKETNRDTGRQAVTRLPVPRLLDPNDPADFTPRGSGECIVCHEGKGDRHDIIFLGDPTPDMEAVDDEAEAISEALQERWKHPIETLPSQGLSAGEQAFIDAFAKQISALQGAGAAPNAGVSQADFEALKAQVATLATRNAELEAAAPKTVARRA